MGWIVVAIAALAAISVLTTKLAPLARAKGHEKLARELEIAHELSHVLVQVLDGHEHGETVIAAAIEAEKSPEAQDLLHAVLKKVQS